MVMLSNSGSFNFVRLAPHFAQDDSSIEGAGQESNL
jgi:hypothetical protein